MLSLSLLERNYLTVSLQIAAHPVHAISFAAGEELLDSIIANRCSSSSCYLCRCWRGTIGQYHCKSLLSSCYLFTGYTPKNSLLCWRGTIRQYHWKSLLTQFMLSLSLLERNYSTVSLQITAHPVHAISFAAGEELFDSIIANHSSPSSCYLFTAYSELAALLEE